MSALIYGHCFVPVSNFPMSAADVLNLPGAYECAQRLAQEEAMRTGGELLIGPALLLTFHEVSMMPHHLVFPMAHETAGAS